MINAAIVGLGWWGKVLVNSVQGKSDTIRFSHGQTRTRAKAEGTKVVTATVFDTTDRIL